MSKSNVKKLPVKKAPVKKSAGYQPCYHTHPKLEIADGIFIYGGNCASPIVKDADIYIALDGSGSYNKRQYPWHKEIAFTYRIVDMSVPTDVAEFKQLLEWLKTELEAGKKVHIGCIGGHGRTGLVFAALRMYMAGDADATNYVRKHYCKKAVESAKQIEWLFKNFKIKKATPTKGIGGSHHSFGGGVQSTKQSNLFPDDWHKWSSKQQNPASDIRMDADVNADFIPSAGSVWGKKPPETI